MKHAICYISVLLLLLLTGCGKEFLDVKYSKTLEVPHRIADFQAIVDFNFLTLMGGGSAHTLAANGSDEYMMTDKKWAEIATGTSAHLRHIYTWAKEIDMLRYESISDWNASYTLIFQANLAIDGLNKIQPGNNERAAWELAKGQAHFIRALRYYHLAQQYAFPYLKHEDNRYGLPLRLEPDVTLNIQRASVHATYQQILKDAEEAAALLPILNNRSNYLRPGKAAAFAILAKIYLQMEAYEKAAEYASKCLELRGGLLDFNTLDAANPDKAYDYTFEFDYGVNNPEVLYYTTAGGSYSEALYVQINQDGVVFDPALMALYEPGDLRYPVYFRKYFDMDNFRYLVFKGSYAGYSYFTGLATDEIYLLRAECNARLNKTEEALDDLNLLLKNRFDPAHYQPVTETDKTALLRLIFRERKRELLFRGVRWEDLRRMNKDPELAQTLVREVGGQRFELVPNDKRYTWPIPLSEVQSAGLEQNPR